MFDRNFEAKVFVVAGQCVEAVRAGGDYFFDAIRFNQFDVLGCGHLIEVFVAKLSDRFAAALLFFAKDADFYSGSVADDDEVTGH